MIGEVVAHDEEAVGKSLVVFEKALEPVEAIRCPSHGLGAILCGKDGFESAFVVFAQEVHGRRGRGLRGRLNAELEVHQIPVAKTEVTVAFDGESFFNPRGGCGEVAALFFEDAEVRHREVIPRFRGEVLVEEGFGVGPFFEADEGDGAVVLLLEGQFCFRGEALHSLAVVALAVMRELAGDEVVEGTLLHRLVAQGVAVPRARPCLGCGNQKAADGGDVDEVFHQNRACRA